MFVVRADNRGDAGQRPDFSQRICGESRVSSVQARLIRIHQRDRFAQQLVGKADLSDVVQQGGNKDILNLRRPHVQIGGDLARQIRDPARMFADRGAAQFDQRGNRHQGTEVGLLQGGMSGLGFLQRLIERLGAFGHQNFKPGIMVSQLSRACFNSSWVRTRASTTAGLIGLVM